MIRLKSSYRRINRNSSNVWLHDFLKHSNLASHINYDENLIVAKPSRSGLCVECKGSKLCEKTRCPIMVKANYFLKSIPLMQTEDINGASPPSVFVERMGYPYVYTGPLVPPVQEDTSIYDLPEL